MRYAGPVRREFGIRTAFNFLGPLTNPAGRARCWAWPTPRRVRESPAPWLAWTPHALVVHGDGGLDEIALQRADYLL